MPIRSTCIWQMNYSTSARITTRHLAALWMRSHTACLCVRVWMVHCTCFATVFGLQHNSQEIIYYWTRCIAGVHQCIHTLYWLLLLQLLPPVAHSYSFSFPALLCSSSHDVDQVHVITPIHSPWPELPVRQTTRMPRMKPHHHLFVAPAHFSS